MSNGWWRFLRVSQHRKWILAVAVALWVPSVGFGVHVLLQFANAPGQLATPPDHWPGATAIPPPHDGSALLLFLHPQCPCSRATIGELEQIIACCSSKVRASVFFSTPSVLSKERTRTDLWNSAARIPGVRVFEDPNGAVAHLFGAHTSGQLLLYDRTLRLVFNGGITASRGHSGDNDGRAAIIALLQGGTSLRRKFPVFGCALFEEQ